jgi:hypothetical protein
VLGRVFNAPVLKALYIRDTQVMNEIKSEYKKVKRRQIIATLFAVPFFIGFIIFGGGAHPVDGSRFGQPIYIWLPVIIAPIIIFFWYTLQNWCCPSCKNYLGKGFNPTYCSKCGTKLTDV